MDRNGHEEDDMASPQTEEYLAKARKYREKMRAAGDPLPTSAAEFRKADQFMDRLTGEPEGVTYEAAVIGEVPGQWVIPSGADTASALLYLHGGGYVMGSSNTHRKMVGHLAKAIGIRAFVADYRLAPEHPYPAAIKDAVTAFRGLLAEGIRPNRIVVAGDSAGGGLTVAMLLSLRDDGRPLPAAAMLLSPWTDLALTGESLTSRESTDLTVTVPGVRRMAEYYLGSAKARAPLASPLYADLRGMPPTRVQVGADELLMDDAVRIAEKMKNSRVDVTIEVFPEMQHVFQFGAGTLPEADDAIARLGEFARKHLGS